MASVSAGILLHRWRANGREFFLVHPGGPFWANKDAGAWSIPKGICLPGEDPMQAARREFAEETGVILQGALVPLGNFRQRSGKTIIAYGLEGDCDPATLSSNVLSLHWPPRSGRVIEVPEVDKGAWLSAAAARHKLVPGQVPILLAMLDQL